MDVGLGLGLLGQLLCCSSSVGSPVSSDHASSVVNYWYVARFVTDTAMALKLMSSNELKLGIFIISTVGAILEKLGFVGMRTDFFLPASI